ncbi:MAG: SBBP repeat-containing protein, partial [FCB group bacterium]
MKTTYKFLPLLFLLLISQQNLFSQVDTHKQNKSSKQKSYNSTLGNNNYFIENKGQWSKEVKFLARLNGLNAWITDDGIVYDFYKIDKIQDSCNTRFNHHLNNILKHQYTNSTIRGHVVKMSLVNQSPTSQNKFIGIDKQETYYNYFIGNDSTKWASFVPLYKKVLIQNETSGINTRYYFDDGKIRYDLIIAPGKNPSEIAFDCDLGNDSQYTKYINENGELVLKTSLGEIIQGKIYAYQEINGQRKEIPCNFKINIDNTIAFNLDYYNKEFPIIIDPLIYSTYIGGSQFEYSYKITNDANGNAFITGISVYNPSDFPITPGAYQNTFNNYENIFVTKLNPTGSALIFSTFIGGSISDRANGIAIDSYANIYISGSSSSHDYPVTSGAFQTKFGGYNTLDYWTAIVTKLNSTGSALIYSTYIGGNNQDAACGIVIDKNENVFISGITNSQNFPVTIGAFQKKIRSFDPNDSFCGFVTKLNSTGSDLIYSTYIGGEVGEYVNDMTMDTSGNIFITGCSWSKNFPVTKGTFQTNLRGDYNTFISKLNSTGTALIYSTYIGGSYCDEALGITIDLNGNAYITGNIQSDDFPVTKGAFQTTRAGYSDANITKLSADGKNLIFSTYFGGGYNDMAQNIALDSSGNIYITGSTGSDNFPTTIGAFQTIYHGNNDVFVTKFNPSCTQIIYSTFLGGSDFDYAHGLSLDNSGHAFITGWTFSNDYPVTPNIFQNLLHGNNDAFVTKLDFLPLNSITLGDIVSPICAGSTIDIPDTIIGIFNQGNLFIAQLSDLNGNFNSPIVLGSITGTTSETFSVVIPKDTPPGNNYRIRIVSTDPQDTSLPNAINLTITSLPIPTITGAKSVCLHNVCNYITDTISGCTYLWSVSPNGSIVGVGSLNKNSLNIIWNSGISGSITLVVSLDSTACTDSTFMVVNINPLPVPKISGPVNVCYPATVQYTSNNGKDIEYKWEISGGNIVGSPDSSSIDVEWDTASQGTITLIQKFTSTECQDSTTIDVALFAYPKPIIYGSMQGCEYNSFQYSSNKDSSINNKWIVAGGTIINSDSSKNVTVLWNKAGSGTITLIQSNILSNCIDSTYLDIIINPVQKVKIIGDSVICNGTAITLSSDIDAESFAWSTGDTTKSITIKKGGIYSLTITDTNGCTSTISKTINEYDFNLIVNTPLKFDSCCTGSISEREFHIKNQSNCKVNIKNIYLKDGRYFSLAGNNFPILLDTNGLFIQQVNFSPDMAIDYSDSIFIEVDNPCPQLLIAKAGGSGIIKALIWIPDTTAKPGDLNYLVPVNYLVTCGKNLPDNDTYKFQIHYE